MRKQFVAALLLAAIVQGAIAAEEPPRRLRCTVGDEARLNRDGSISKSDADWFKGYAFTVDLETGAVGFGSAGAETWRIVQRGGYATDFELVADRGETDFIRIRAWSLTGPRPIVFFRATAMRAYSGICVPAG